MTPSLDIIIVISVALFFFIIGVLNIVITLRLISRIILVEEKLADLTGEDLNMNP